MNDSNFPSRWEMLRPRTWQHRGSLTGLGTAEARYESGQSPSLLAIHGFGGTPREVDLLVDEAKQLGLAASAPLLPGHGTHVHSMAATHFEDWLNAARGELDRLRAQGDVIVAGLSLGAVIAARLAAETKVAGLVLLANALWLHAPYPALWLALAEHAPLPRSWWVPKLAPDVEDAQGRKEHLGHDAQLIGAAIEVYRGGRDSRGRLGAITCPTLLMHGALDKVCPVKNAQRVVRALGTTDCHCVILQQSGHILTRDRERHTVAQEFRRFLARLVARPIAP
jgi:carboxylesterase